MSQALVFLLLLTGIRAAPYPTKLYGSGATTVQKIFGDLAATINKNHNVRITYGALGSGEGRKDFVSSVNQFAASDVPFSALEEGQLGGAVKFTLPYVLETITVFTYGIPGNPKIKFSPQILAQIFQGKISVWDHPAILRLNPGLKFRKKLTKITVVRRKDVSGSTQLFTSWLAKTAPSLWKLGGSGKITWPATLLAGNGSSGVAAVMKAHPYSIGYLGTGIGLSLGLNENLVPNQAGAYVRASTADVYGAVPRSLPTATAYWSGVTLLNRRGQRTWPISSFVYIFARQNQIQSGLTGALLKSWLTFLWSAKGQSIVTKYNFYPVPSTVRAQNLAAIKSIILSPGVNPPF